MGHQAVREPTQAKRGLEWGTVLTTNFLDSMEGQASVPRDVFPPTPPGPEGSNGNGLFRVQWVAGAWLFCKAAPSPHDQSALVPDFRSPRIRFGRAGNSARLSGAASPRRYSAGDRVLPHQRRTGP